MIKNRLITAILLCCFLSGCATSRGIPYTHKKYPPKTSNTEILLTTKDIDRPYEEIGMIEARSETSGEYLRKELISRAQKMGADAVIKIQYDIQNKGIGSGIGTPVYSQLIVTSVQETVARGLAVVFTDTYQKTHQEP